LRAIGAAAIQQAVASGQPVVRRLSSKGIYTDFKRHDLGRAFHERNFNGTVQTEFMTEPLWGVGSTAPYGHDGRSISLREVILRHGGEASNSRRKFRMLPEVKQDKILSFLSSLVLFEPPDTASNLDPAMPLTPGFAQFGHGSIKLSALFNNPGLPE
jgi:cytochrome c peroxidase